MKSIGKVKVGTYANQKELAAEYMASGKLWTSEKGPSSIMEREDFHLCSKQIEVELFLISPIDDLGMTSGRVYENVIRVAIGKGYYCCSAEIGPLIVLKYPEIAKKIPSGTKVAMLPIYGGGMSLLIFSISEDCLNEIRTFPSTYIEKDELMVFASVCWSDC